MTRYHDNLLKLQETHPTVYAEFKNELFSIKRTNKSFSRIPIDLTLEQTINADAACQRTGVSVMRNSISAKQRWAKSHYIRTSTISHLFRSLGITKKEYVTKELKPYKYKYKSKYKPYKYKPYKHKIKGGEKDEITKMTHDLFGSILVLSLQKKS